MPRSVRPVDTTGVEVIEVDGQEVEVPIPKATADGTFLAVGVEELEITDADTLQKAVELAAELDRTWKEGEAARDFLVRPLNAHVAAINGLFKPKHDQIKGAFTTLKAKIRDYHAERTRKEQEAARAAADFLGASDEVKDIVGSAATNRVAVTEAGAPVTTATVWDYEVLDLKELCGAIAAGKAPVELVAPAKGEIRRSMNEKVKAGLITAREDGDVVNGIRYYRKQDVRL